MKPTKDKYTARNQICNLIPPFLVTKIVFTTNPDLSGKKSAGAENNSAPTQGIRGVIFLLTFAAIVLYLAVVSRIKGGFG
jgi:hypothetical protein